MGERGVVLVTGGSGYIAGYCIAQLLNEGWTVRATLRSLSREPEVRRSLEPLCAPDARLSFHTADLMADAGWPKAVEGADYVMHVASPLPSSDPQSADDLIIPARDGTLRVLKAAKAAGVKRVVETSSVAAIAYGRGGRESPHTEADWSDDANLKDIGPYERSKTIAERAAWDWHKREGGAMELCMVNPGAVLGPVLGADFSASLEIVKMILQGALPACPRFGFPIVDVRDVADLHYRAMLAPNAPGQRYIAANGFLWMKDVAAVLKEGLPDHPKPIPTSELPDLLLRVSALFNPVVRGRLFELGKKRDASGAKARSELGWSPRPPKDSIMDAARSMIALKIV
ncbi:MAG: aldehyde reductase [Hyphomonadaceae bacterium]|nr:aldehyde reductase [Hyphomonadaceae bacterium]